MLYGPNTQPATAAPIFVLGAVHYSWPCCTDFRCGHRCVEFRRDVTTTTHSRRSHDTGVGLEAWTYYRTPRQCDRQQPGLNVDMFEGRPHTCPSSSPNLRRRFDLELAARGRARLTFLSLCDMSGHLVRRSIVLAARIWRCLTSPRRSSPPDGRPGFTPHTTASSQLWLAPRSRLLPHTVYHHCFLESDRGPHSPRT